MLEFVKEKPEWAKMSGYLCEKAEGYVIVLLTGHRFCIPVTPDFKKAFGLTRSRDELYCKRGSELRVEKVIRSIIDSVYLQVRDTIGAGISANLSQQLNDFMEEKLGPGFDALVESQLNQKMLPKVEEPDA